MARFGKAETLAHLDGLGIPYELVEHGVVYTMEGMDELDIPFADEVVKNLFLRDSKKRAHYLAVMPGAKRADLKALRAALSSRPLSFASEEELEDILGVHAGAVTPLAVLNDEERLCEVVLDEELRGWPGLGVHPCDNTATIRIAPADLLRVFDEHGTPYRFVEMP